MFGLKMAALLSFGSSLGHNRDLKAFADTYCQVTPFLHDILLNPCPIFHYFPDLSANAFICTIFFQSFPWNLSAHELGSHDCSKG